MSAEKETSGAVGVVHLWEVKHAYYCNEGNYCMRDAHTEYKSLAEFLEDNGDADLDYNLVYRFDWDEEDGDGESTFTGDVNYRNGVLKIYWMGQRKACARSTYVEVCRADEPSVIAFLQPRMDYMARLWAPMTPTPASQERATPSSTLAEQSSTAIRPSPATQPRHEENNNE